jgi:cytidine deaminase
LNSSEKGRLSVALVDVQPNHEAEFLTLATAFEALLLRKNYGRAETIPDESIPHRYYAVRHWHDVASAELCHADADVQTLTSKLYAISRITHVVNGVRRPDPLRLTFDDRRAKIESDRRMGFERRSHHHGSPTGVERRKHLDRRLGPRRTRERATESGLVAAARRARENADAAYSKFKVGAALETADGTVVTGCNIENATYGLTICAERVAIFKALSEGHRAFARIAIVADTESATPPCGACRQILWEFAGNLEVRLANLKTDLGTFKLKDLLPHPFDARLL